METKIIIKATLTTVSDEKLTQENADKILLDTSQLIRSHGLINYEKEIEIVE